MEETVEDNFNKLRVQKTNSEDKKDWLVQLHEIMAFLLDKNYHKQEQSKTWGKRVNEYELTFHRKKKL